MDVVEKRFKSNATEMTTDAKQDVVGPHMDATSHVRNPLSFCPSLDASPKESN
jgi:hypothetical protein